VIHIDRSRISAYQKCPASRYWGYLYKGTGLERVQQAVPLLTGTLIHQPITDVLTGVDPLGAIAEAKGAYLKAVTERGLQLDANEVQAQIANEQLALIEALTLGFFHVRLPRLLEEYKVVEVETESHLDFAYQGETLRYMARPDVVLERRSDEQLLIVDFKTASNAAFLGKRLRYDNVTLSQVLPIEAKYQRKVLGVVIEVLVKGSRTEYKGIKQHNSPLIYAWRKPPKSGNPPFEPEAGERWATRYEWECTEPHTMDSGKACKGNASHKLSGYYKAKVWEEYPGGIPAWIDYLKAIDLPLLEQQFISLPPIMRDEYEVERWKRSTFRKEVEIARCAEQVAASPELLDELFPPHMSNGNCTSPSICPMTEICHSTAGADPIGSGLYQIRQSNHPIENEVEA
jgi:hypothetical protein